jgi:threonine aldolase
MSSETRNAWSEPGPAEFDFRSDVVTTPTINMLAAIQSTTLLDDVYNEDPTTVGLEKFVADLTGKQAGLLVLSGTMGNQVSLRAHLGGPPHSVIADHRSHVALWEAGGVSANTGALLHSVVPKNGHHLTLEDVQSNAVLDDDVHVSPTRVISLENTLNGTILPLQECKRISAWGKEHGIIMHLDGARLWEAVASGAGDLKEYCELFDSISLCFSKGLGAPIGSIVVGDDKFIKKARWIRKMMGGGLRQAGVISSAARVSVVDTFLGQKLHATHEKAKRVGDLWAKLGGKFFEPVETNMVWIELEDMGLDSETFISMAGKHGIRVSGSRFVIHYQTTDEAISRLEALLREVAQGKIRK